MTPGSSFVDLGVLAWVFSLSEKEMDRDKMERTDWDEVLNIRPIESIPKKALGYDIEIFNRWIEHKDNADYWKKQS